MESALATLARSLLAGEACYMPQQEEDHHRSLPNVFVRRLLGHAPLAVELAVARLARYDRMLKDTQHHRYFSLFLFGELVEFGSFAAYLFLSTVQVRYVVLWVFWMSLHALYVEHVYRFPKSILLDDDLRNILDHVNEVREIRNPAIKVYFISNDPEPRRRTATTTTTRTLT